jgi:hypothetical protein
VTKEDMQQTYPQNAPRLTAVFIQIVAGLFSTCCPFQANTLNKYPRNITKSLFNLKFVEKKIKWLQLATHPQSPLPQSLKYKALLPHPMIRSEANCFSSKFHSNPPIAFHQWHHLPETVLLLHYTMPMMVLWAVRMRT